MIRSPFVAGLALSLLPINGWATGPKVVVDIAPLHSIVAEVMNGVGEPALLIEPEASPHSYSLRPSEAEALAEADAVFWIGEGLTPWLEKSLDTLAGDAQRTKMMAVEATTTHSYREGATFETHDDHDQENEKHDDASHDDGHAYEWAGAFELSAGEYVWSFAKVDGDYADPKMKMAIIESDAKGEAAIESEEKAAEDLIKSPRSSERVHGELLTPNDSSAYQLMFDPDRNVTEFRIVVESAGVYTFFTEHMPFEFEAEEHFFKTTDRQDVEPTSQEPDSVDHHHHHHHHGKDPHAWLDPMNAKIWAGEIARVLAAIDSSNTEVYQQNAEAFAESMDELMASLDERATRLDGTRFIVFHDAYQYFERRFDLPAAGAISISDASDPSPARIREIQGLVSELGVTCAFAEPQFNPGLLDTVFEASEVRTIGVMDPLGVEIDVGLGQYPTLIRQLMSSLEKCQ